MKYWSATTPDSNYLWEKVEVVEGDFRIRAVRMDGGKAAAALPWVRGLKRGLSGLPKADEWWEQGEDVDAVWAKANGLEG